MTYEELQTEFEKLPDGEAEEILDELVHDICSRQASLINNGGPFEQLHFIEKELGDEGRQILSGLLKGALRSAPG